MYQSEERTRLKKHRAEQAIQLALQSRWEEAAQANRSIIELFPNDVEAFNRLGKALMELGRYPESREAYKRALEIEPTSIIARKNLDRLDKLEKTGVGPTEKAAPIDPQIFIEEMGKTGVTHLLSLNRQAVLKMAAGDPVNLEPKGAILVAESTMGETLGSIEPKLANRLLALIEGGNRYAAAISRVNDSECLVIIKEIYQAPNLVGRPSFPSTASTEEVRPYIKDRLLRRDTEEEEGEDIAAEEEDWEAETEGSDADIHISEMTEEEEPEPEE